MNDPSRYPVALDNHIRLAAEIGILLSCFACVDLFPAIILAKMLQISDSNAGLLLGNFQSFAKKIAILDLIARANSGNDGVITLCKWMLKCNALRNKYAHRMYTANSDGKKEWFLASSWVPDLTRKTVHNTITPESVSQESSIIRSTLFYLERYRDHNESPPEPYE